jgi:WhiB family transcriptional regulator, redox-sensing transcriptional regulator
MCKHATTENTDRQLLAQLTPSLVGPALDERAQRGQCTQTDPEIFFPPKGDRGKEARGICARCPVRVQCLAYAVAADEGFGIWGGLNRAERVHLRDAVLARQSATRSPGQGAA